jgi:hypothetical protein
MKVLLLFLYWHNRLIFFLCRADLIKIKYKPGILK